MAWNQTQKLYSKKATTVLFYLSLETNNKFELLPYCRFDVTVKSQLISVFFA